MMELMAASVLIYLTLCDVVAPSKLELMQVVTDFLVFQKAPAKVSSFLCCKTDESNALIKSLFHLNVLAIVNEINETKLRINHPATQQLYLLDATCNGYMSVLAEANEMKMFAQPFRWLITKDANSHIPEYLEIYVDSNVYVVESTDSSYVLKTIYRLSKYSQGFVTNDVAMWTRGVGFGRFNALDHVRRRSNLMGITLNVSYVFTNLDSLNHLWDYRDKHIDAISKLNYIFTSHISDYMNASLNSMTRSTWGYRNDTTGLYSGMIGDLQTERAELGGTPSFFTTDRIPIIDYIAPTTPTRAKFIFRAPPLSYVMNVYTLPFDAMVWYAGFLLLGIIAVVVYVIVSWEWRDAGFKEVLDERPGGLRARFFDVVLMELGAIGQQGAESEPRSVSGRTATIFIFLTLMFMYTAYSANIVALLQSTTDSIKTLEDLLNSRMKLGVEDVSYSHYYFKAATESTRKAIYTQRVAPKGQPTNFMKIDDGIRKMRNEFFAFHVESASGYKVVGDTFQESEKCGLQEIEYLQVIDPWIAMKKNSTYKEVAKIGFRKLHETGLQNREFRRLYTKKPVCQSKGSNFMSVGLTDCYYAFLIFSVGVVCSLSLLLIECAFERCNNMKNNNNNRNNNIRIDYLE